MVEQIHDPLVHLVRNAVDHGIETPEERQGAGKPRRGTIRLSASQGGGSIVLDIRDDGRGLDAENIRAKAIKTGLLPPEETAREDETYELIFHAGFSTREQVTEVSGRGVGMDVVKTAVEKLRGKLAVFNTPGRGAHFQIRLPLTTAIIDGMTVRVGDQRYVVPTLSVREFLQPQESACRWIQRKLEMVHIREALLPLVRLHRLLEVPPERTDPWEAILLVVHEGDRRYCLMADEIIGRQEVVIKSLGGAMRHLRGVSGGAILGDGRVALILDIRGIVSLFEESRG
jgi:two-component system chemotaxis sensor kinase CheA